MEVGGERLIDRLVRVFCQHGATEIDIICNEQMTVVRQHLEQLRQTSRVPLQFIVKSTPSSMHSAWELSHWLGDGPFVLTTVDTIFREEEFGAYVAELRRLVDSGEADGLMGVTDYIDDEKPLYVSTDDELWITGFLDTRPLSPSLNGEGNHIQYISGGIYGLTPRSIDTLRRCIERGESRMRNFQRALIADGLRLRAWPFSKVLDIDHKSDIQKAESFLSVKGYSRNTAVKS